MKTTLLPYQPTLYPGEICGSWFARLKAHNTQYLWNSAISSLGIRHERQYRVFDLYKCSPATESVLNFLGISLTDAMSNLSTTPFGNAFDAPLLHRHYQLPQYCAACIRDDINQYGEPYWHTEHQLPNAMVCRKHFVLLRDRCPSCSRTLGAKDNNLISPLSHKCKCGVDLRSQTQAIASTSDKRYHLSLLSYEALQEKNRSWSYPQVIDFLLTKTKTAQELHDVLQRTWGQDKKIYIPWDNGRPLKALRALDIAAALVALGVKYSDAIHGFTSTTSSVRLSMDEQQMRDRPSSLSAAKKSMLEYRDKFPQKKLYENRIAYEFIRIHDLEWMKSTFPASGNVPIPSIRSDRESIVAILKRSEEQNKPSYITTYPEHVRTRIRDAAWLSSYIKNRKPGKKPRINAASSVPQDRIEAMIKAIEKVLAASARPRKITARFLSSSTGLSYAMISTAISRDSDLWERLHSANMTLKEMRVIDWLNNSELTDRKIGTRMLMEEIGMMRTSENIQFVQKIIDQHLS